MTVPDLQLKCPKCGNSNLPAPASPTLECEQDGSYTCTICATHFILRPQLVQSTIYRP